METLNLAKGQEHLTSFIENSSVLAEQVQSLDWQEIAVAVGECITNKDDLALPENYDPASYFPLKAETSEQEELYKKAQAFGEELISEGKCGAFTVAGGQGTRLGYDGPKGTLPVSPIKNKSLFQLFAEQIAGVSKKYNTVIPWYIMCSPLNEAATISFFEENDFFGLSEDNVKFFAQGVMPATDFTGKLLVANADSLAFSPNGHGGSLKALIDSGSVADMNERGVEHMSYFQVDNPLISILNPLFVGLHALQNSDMSSRSLTKTGPFEKLGNFVVNGEEMSIIEYSDLPDEKAEEVDANGVLRYRAGSPAMHLFRRDFLEQFADASLKLPYHRAEKKVPFINEAGEQVKPEENNAVKFETFVFDALPMAKNPLILETERLEEFSPVKNKTGVDSLDSSQADQIKRAQKWLSEIGFTIPQSCVIEISPLAYPSIADLEANKGSFGPFESNKEYYLG